MEVVSLYLLFINKFIFLKTCIIKTFKAYLSFFIVLFLGIVSNAQVLPPILNYTTNNYEGGNQNWAITQTSNDVIYVANNDGLLEFNGARWNVYPTPNKSIVRSVLAVGDRVYSGCYMDFGYWKRNEENILVYHSLSKQLKLKILEDEQFWNIITYDNWVLFQSLNRIYFYNTENQEVHFISSKNTLHKLFKTGDEIFYQVLGEGLFTLKNGKGILLNSSSIFKTDVITSLQRDNQEIHVVMRENGLHELKNGIVVKKKIPANDVLESTSIYNSIFLSDGNLVVGTIANGVYVISKAGAIKHHINQSNGLNDNTALSLFQDSNENIWIGLDNGIDCINLGSAFSSYVDRVGRLGTIYTSLYHDNKLYVGTNQGLFFKQYNSEDQFQFIEGTKGQVWCLQAIDEKLFCGHNGGTFIVEDGKAIKISTVMGTWGIKRIPGNPDLLLQGNYDGLHVLQKEGETWRLRNKLDGFDIASKYFAINGDTIFVSHEYKGVFKLKVDQNYFSIEEVYKEQSVEKGAHSSLETFDNKIMYANENGIFYYDNQVGNFKVDEILSKIIQEDPYVSGVMINENAERLWIFTKNYINAVTKDKINNSYRVQKIPIKETVRDQMKGYENISRIVQNKYLLGTSNGYLMINLDATFKSVPTITLDNISVGISNEDMTSVPLRNIEMPPNKNYINFEYSIPVYQKFLEPEYKHRLLKDNDASWSSWTSTPSVSYQNLPYGEYSFQVKAKINNEELSTFITHSFIVAKPWYATTTAIILYSIIGILLFFGINSLYSFYFKRQRERLLAQSTRDLKMKELESQKKIIQLKNDSLNQDISARNRELAISTMSTIKKNEALSNIKQALLDSKTSKDVQSVVELIDDTMNDTKDWQFFEEAFNHADKDFFKKVKQLHPELTANDLRLCVYLRLNLSSKEIAPLLNISTRSVEIKRYRLRKKIALDKNLKLNDYFINL